MPADDPDPKFERALAHHLRGDSAAACPDAETLAAYHERSLSLEEMAHWKQHLSGCAACQETLALVETTEKNLAEDWKGKQIPVLAAAAQPPAAVRSLATARDEAPGEEAPAATQAPVEISRRRRPPLLRWAIPLGAVAAGVLVWIGVHEQGAKQALNSVTVQTAKNQPAPAPEPKLTDTLPSVQPPMERDDREARLKAEGIGKRPESSDVVSQLVVTPAKPGANAKDIEQAQKELDGQTADAVAHQMAPAPPPAPVLRRAQPKAPASANENLEVSAAPAAVAPAPGAVVSGGAVGSAAAETDAKAGSRVRKEKTLSEQQAANELQTTTNAMMMKQGMMNRAAGASALSPPPILTPDNRVWWKLDPAGALNLTTDGGKTWKSVDTAAAAQLTAGSAPSSKICWIAGKAGTLVLTIDRGAHWKVLNTPITGDLGGVRATDAKHASIWDATRQQSFKTSDGGATWTPTAP